MDTCRSAAHHLRWAESHAALCSWGAALRRTRAGWGLRLLGLQGLGAHGDKPNDNETHPVQLGGVPEADARWFFQQFIIAVDYCHRLGIANRDVKVRPWLRAEAFRA